jgi:uncharacterized membrane protein
MKASSLSRFLAVLFLCIPLAWFYSHHAQRSLDQINASPAEYLQHARSLQHPSYLYNFILMLFLLGAVVFVVEGIAELIGRWLPERRRVPAEVDHDR